jgi:hypothetical protein
MHHLGRDIYGLFALDASIPMAEHGLRHACHEVREARDALAMKSGLDQPPLP